MSCTCVGQFSQDTRYHIPEDRALPKMASCIPLIGLIVSSFQKNGVNQVGLGDMAYASVSMSQTGGERIRRIQVVNQYSVASIINFSLMAGILITLVALKIIAPLSLLGVAVCLLGIVMMMRQISSNADEIKQKLSQQDFQVIGDLQQAALDRLGPTVLASNS